MKKIVILCVLLIVTNISFAQNNPFLDPEIKDKVSLDLLFKERFIKKTVTNIALKAKMKFTYEITYDALVIYKHTVYGTSAADATYSDKWFYIPLKDLYLNTTETTKDFFVETAELSFTNKLKRIVAGNGTKYNLASEDTYLQEEINIPFILDGEVYTRNVFEYLNATLAALRGEVKEDVVNKASAAAEESSHQTVDAVTVKKEYFATGEIKSETPLLNGKTEGKQIEYYKNGKINFYYTYKNGIENGPYEYYFENGQLGQKSNQINGKFNGPFREYYENGRLKNESVNIDGVYQGYVTEYDVNGKLLSKKYYVMGKISGTLDICEGVNYLIKKLDDKKDKELADKNWMKENFEGILDFKYRYFTEEAYMRDGTSSCNLEYLPNAGSNEALFLQYAKIKAALNNCPKLIAGEEHNENSDIATLKSNIYKYNKSIFVKLEATTLAGGSITLYVSRTGN